MANRFPLVVDSSNQNIKELPDGDSLLLGDSEKLLLGDGTDLQIYHDGSNSFIDDAGTGNLQIRGTQVKLQKYTGENMFVGISDGAASMYYDNSQKIATTSTGIDVTGTATMDGLTVNSGTANTVATFQSTDDTATLVLTDNDTTNKIHSSATGLRFEISGSERMRVNSTGIDVTGKIVASTSAAITQVALTSSSNAVAWDAAAAANAYHVTTENTTFAAPSNAVEGAIISVEIAQGGTARTVAWNTVFEFAASTAPTVTATANKTDIFAFRYNGSVWQEIGRVQNMAQT